jgi:hypothetical protein
MRPNKHQVFRTDAAAKLDQLELIAALLERDATNNRVLVAELGSTYSHRKTAAEVRRSQRWHKWWKVAHAANAVAHRCIAAAKALARSRRLHSAIRTGFAFGVDFAVVLVVACAGVAALAIAILVTAPPV